MNDELNKDLQELANTEGVELSDDVLDDDGRVVMRLDSLSRAEHWAGNLRTNAQMLTADEFLRMRKKHSSL